MNDFLKNSSSILHYTTLSVIRKYGKISSGPEWSIESLPGQSNNDQISTGSETFYPKILLDLSHLKRNIPDQGDKLDWIPHTTTFDRINYFRPFLFWIFFLDQFEWMTDTGVYYLPKISEE